MSVYTVKKVLDRKEWSGNFGPMVTYVMDVEDESGEFSPKVELNRKPESREPQEGERFAGHLEETNFAEKLKVDFEATKELSKGGGYEAKATSGGSTNSKPASSGETDWTVRNAEIRRQHSQEMAVRWLSLSKKEFSDTNLIKEMADWFDQDAIAAGQSHGQPAQGPTPMDPPVDLSGARTEEPAPPTNTVDRDHIMQLLSSAGLVYAGAQEKVADFIMGPLTVNGRVKGALGGLQDLDRQGVVLAQLKSETEQWTKQPLPQGDALDGDFNPPF